MKDKIIDDMSFFHQATIKICGSLNEHKMIRECQSFLCRFLPAETIVLSTYDEKENAIHILAGTAFYPVPVEKRAIFLSPQAGQFLCNLGAVGARIYPKENKTIVLEEILSALDLPDSSSLVLHLKIDEKILGVVQFFPGKGEEFTKEHARLINLIHDPFAVALANVLKHRELIRIKDRISDDNRYLWQELRNLSDDEIIGARYGLKGVMEQVRQVAPLITHVMLTGETGVGKEVIAGAIQKASARADGPFIKVNCGAFPEELLDSELFGYEKGAFTGASQQRRGRFERAHGGTLFLDEIGELTPAAQVRLLRVLQDGRIERVGSTGEVVVDVRIIAATHRNLEKMVQKGTFREDLWFRLNVFPIHIPPLRQRKADIPELVHYFIDRKMRNLGMTEHPGVTAVSMEKLMAQGWPGNIRELENMVERALIQYQGKRKGTPLEFLGLEANEREVEKKEPKSQRTDTPLTTLNEVMRHYIEQVLHTTGGKIQGEGGAAQILGLHPNTLRSRMEKLRIPFGRTAKEIVKT